jgi:hypothetical protein
MIQIVLQNPESRSWVRTYSGSFQQACRAVVKEYEDQYEDILVISPRVIVEHTTRTDEEGVVRTVTTYLPGKCYTRRCDCMIIDLEYLTKDAWFEVVVPLLQFAHMKVVLLLRQSIN